MNTLIKSGFTIKALFYLMNEFLDMICCTNLLYKLYNWVLL